MKNDVKIVFSFISNKHSDIKYSTSSSFPALAAAVKIF